MKITEINKYIKKYLQPYLINYEVNKDLIYNIEQGFFIKGYAFESTGNDEYDLAIWCFIQPLFVKSDCLYFNFGSRLKYKEKVSLFRTKELEWWDARKENLDKSFISILQSILKDGEKYLSSFKTPKDFYSRFKPNINDDVRANEAVSYTTVLLNENELTNKMLKGLIRYCEKEIKVDIDNVIEIQIREDATLLLETVIQEERLEILKSWANETLSHLKLPGVQLK